MDIRNTIGNVFGIVLLFIVALGVLQQWDDEDGARRASELKDQAIKYAVEQYGGREYFRSDFHCRVPLKGERLEMQHAATHDPGRGYRCVYRIMLPPPGVKKFVTASWSRSPELLERPLGSTTP